jgi:serpin B
MWLRLLRVAFLGWLLAVPSLGMAGGNAGAPGTPEAFAATLDRFGLALLRELSAGTGDGNVLVSPLSIAVALAMVAKGAERPARDAIATTLGIEGQPTAVTARAMADFLRRLRRTADGGGDVTFIAANGIWTAPGLDVFPAFVEALELRFGAEPRRIDFAGPGAAGEINAWVAEATRGMIPEIVGGLSPSTTMVLANALYFKGLWTNPFDPADTTDRPFTTAAGGTANVPTMMLSNTRLMYREDAWSQAVELPYGVGGFSLRIVLPKDPVVGLAELVERALADAGSLGDQGFQEIEGTVALPRFDIGYGASLPDALRALGLGPALDDPNSFAGIASPPPALGNILHRAALSVDEEGSVTAAATAVIMTRALASKERFEMIVDRPFLVVLRHRRTGVPAFVGFVADPAGDG